VEGRLVDVDAEAAVAGEQQEVADTWCLLRPSPYVSRRTSLILRMADRGRGTVIAPRTSDATVRAAGDACHAVGLAGRCPFTAAARPRPPRLRSRPRVPGRRVSYECGSSPNLKAHQDRARWNSSRSRAPVGLSLPREGDQPSSGAQHLLDHIEVVDEPRPARRVRRAEVKDGDATAQRRVLEIAVERGHRQGGIVRVAHLSEVDVTRGRESARTCPLDGVTAAVEEQDDRLGDVLVREEGEGYWAAAAGRDDAVGAASAARMSCPVRSGYSSWMP
jgi:hypothetical protein